MMQQHEVEAKKETPVMGPTLSVAQAWLKANGWTQVRVDRWTKLQARTGEEMFVELGYVYGAVWFKGKVARIGFIHNAETRDPNDIEPLKLLVQVLDESR